MSSIIYFLFINFNNRNHRLVMSIPTSKWLSWCPPWHMLKIIYWINKYTKELISDYIKYFLQLRTSFGKIIPNYNNSPSFNYCLMLFSPNLMCKSFTLAKQVFHLLMKMLKSTKKWHIKNQWKLLHLYFSIPSVSQVIRWV